MTRIYLANVGANTSHRFASPIFEDGAFEFLPIPESPRLDSPRAVRYRDLRPHDSRRELSRYVPPRLWDRACHNDPEFDTFTYGDECDDHARAVGLRGLQPGDVLLFLAGLEHWAGDERTGQYGFFLIGGLRIDWVLPRVTQEPAGRDGERVRSERPRRPGALHRFLGRVLGVRRVGRVAQVRAGGPGNQGDLREGVQDRLGQSLGVGAGQVGPADDRFIHAHVPLRVGHERPRTAAPRRGAAGVDSDVGPRRRSRHSGRLTPCVDAGTPAGETLNDAESAKWTEMHRALTRKWRRFTSGGRFQG